ncbi:MoxR family ATPase [Streptomyces thermocarboxydovorans]|uniref:MoxR family ATPase n=1 Tax=Streptomyces thermocarboxydovorans TaxID=59298 RepID=A0ABN1HUL3_9ACTN
MEGNGESGRTARRATAPEPQHTSHSWWLYRGSAGPAPAAPVTDRLPPPPPWRDFDGGPVVPGPPPRDEAATLRRLGAGDMTMRRVSVQEADMVNAALFLRRPLIVTGPLGSGRSSLAYRVSRELGLGRVLHWRITGSTTLADGLYDYDAVGRLQDAAIRGASRGTDTDTAGGLGDFFQLGPLGTALIPREAPRVLLIDDLDKADLDLLDGLTGIIADGEFRIPELSRTRSREPDVVVHTDDPDGTYTVHHGRIRCRAFPFVVITCGGERALPADLLRHCLCLEMPAPGAERLAGSLAARFATGDGAERLTLIRDFLGRSLAGGTLATDQLLDSEYLRTAPSGPDEASLNRLLHALWRPLDTADPA